MKTIIKAYLYLLKPLLKKKKTDYSKKNLLLYILIQTFKLPLFLLLFNNKREALRMLHPISFSEWEVRNKKPIRIPLGKYKVSVIVRTCMRPEVLKETLNSLRKQTYSNFEVVVIEDGKNLSENLIKTEFKDLQINYFSTGTKVGRCIAGNLGMEKATGDYFNFLDDDDLFYPDHLETLIKQLEENPAYKIAYTLSFETPITQLLSSPYTYKEISYEVTQNTKFSRFILFHHNYIPIQTIMFHRSLFQEEGGFDTSLDVFEDWDLWIRYSINNDFLYIKKITSIYRVPADPTSRISREKIFAQYLPKIREKHKNYQISISLNSIALEMENLYQNGEMVLR